MSVARNAVFWQDGHPVDRGAPLDGSAACDVCVVGAGFTGLWTAHFLKAADPTLDVRVIERDIAGGGASGTADGFVTPTIGKDLTELINSYGPERTAAACVAVGRSIVDIGRFVVRYGIDADYEAKDYLLVAVDEPQVARLRRLRDQAEGLGGRFEITLLDGPAAREHVGSPAIQAAVRTGGGLVNPFKLARGLLSVVLDQGVPVHERTPASRVEPVPGGHRVITPNGSIRADKVVLATSAHQRSLSGFRRKVLPLWSYALVSEPLTGERLARVRWPDRTGLVEAKTFLNCGRLTADNRLLWAGGSARYFFRGDMRPHRMRGDRAYRELRESFVRFFPMWQDIRFDYAYGGCVDVTRDLVPHFGSRAPGLFHGYGYCGNGIAATHLGGKVLRDLVLGRSTAYTSLLFVDGREPSFPPEPLAFAGARLMSRIIERREARV